MGGVWEPVAHLQVQEGGNLRKRTELLSACGGGGGDGGVAEVIQATRRFWWMCVLFDVSGH